MLKNFNYNDTGASDVGVFGRAGHALFSRVGLPNADVTGSGDVGALLGEGGSSLVVASFVTGSVNGVTHVGGIAGYRAYVHNSYSLATIVGTQQVGGLIGATNVVEDSFAVGSITGTGADVGPVVDYPTLLQ